ncbi:nuclear factor NF-kappa-B p100 subunit isoform X2 [Venturia canescens]|nr:nuclear factor NF-kappa-B p100 subunit-like isoform X2 [Venturia canescens]
MESQTMSSVSSPMSMSLSPQTDESSSNMFAMNDESFMNFTNSTAIELPAPRVVILDQPVDKFRFRYKSEMMGTHGCLSSASTKSRRKRQAPTAKLINFVGQKAKIRCTLVTSDPDRRMPHAHHLVKREGNSENEAPYEIEVSAENDFIAQFHGMGIIHTAKKNIKTELVRKMMAEALEKHRCKNRNITSLRVSEETQIKMDADAAQKWMNLNSVSLCFQAFVEDDYGIMKPITEPTYSIAINNLKSALTGELKICRIDKFSSPCEGGEEVFMLVEKVGKKNIKVKFFEVDENDHEIWSGYGRFSELDVHHQYAIVFKTPPYNREITAPKEVYIKLERPTDGDFSEPIKFTYKPRDCIFNKKRPRISYSGSSELSSIKQSTNNMNLTSNGSFENASQELIKWLGAQNKLTSDEYAKFLNSIDIPEYAKTLDQAEYDSMLTTDGGSSQNNEANFAENLVLSTMKKIEKTPTKVKDLFTKMFEERSTYGDTALHSALRHGQREIVKHILVMLASDPDLSSLVHVKNSSGKTPLHYAVLLNQPEVVKALLLLGADPNERDDRDFYPLYYAVKSPEAGACVDALLSKTVKLSIRDDAGWTLLQLAVEAGSIHAVKSLIKAGADVNETEVSYGRTALHIAVENGHTEIVKYLLEKTDIDVNKTNLGGNTALHSAVVNPGDLAKEMCKLLVEHGADPFMPNNSKEPMEEDDDKDLAVSVKEEIYCDETMEEDGGQTSIDLASNKPEILRLLTKGGESSATITNASTVEIKEEVADVDDTLSEHLDTILLDKLAIILDRNRSWERLAKHLKCEYLLSTIDAEQSSPSMIILNYADIQGNLTRSSLINILTEIGEKKAASFIEQMTSP